MKYVKNTCMSFFILIGFVNCQDDFEKKTILYTELVEVTEKYVKVNTNIVDIESQESILESGHCWSINSNPTVEDGTLLNEAIPSETQPVEAIITAIQANKTYFIRAYVKYTSGSVYYGNQITATTGLVNGRWTRQKDFIGALITYESECFYECNESSYYEYSPCTIQSTPNTVFGVGAFQQNLPVLGLGVYKYWRTLDNFSLPADLPETCPTSSEIGPGYGDAHSQFLYQYNNNTWQLKSTAPFLNNAGSANASNGNFLFVGMGGSGYSDTGIDADYPIHQKYFNSLGVSSACYVLNLNSGVWFETSAFPGAPRGFAATFMIKNKVFVATGWNGYGSGGSFVEDCSDIEANNIFYSDFWSYNITTNLWEKLPDFPGAARFQAVGFTINGKGYVGSGFTSTRVNSNISYSCCTSPFQPVNDFWEFTPETNSWKKIADFPGPARGSSVGFGIGDYGYFGLGLNRIDDPLYSWCSHVESNQAEIFYKDFWRYSQSTNTWTQLPDFPGYARMGAIGMASSTLGYVGLGLPSNDGQYVLGNDIWLYDPYSN